MKHISNAIALTFLMFFHSAALAGTRDNVCPANFIVPDVSLDTQLDRMKDLFSFVRSKDGKSTILEYEARRPCSMKDIGWVSLSGAVKVTERDELVDAFAYEYTFANVDSECIATRSKCRRSAASKTAVSDMEIDEARRIVDFLRHEKRRDSRELTYASFFANPGSPLSIDQYEIRRFEVSYVAANRGSYVQVKVERDGLGKYHVIGVGRNAIESPH